MRGSANEIMTLAAKAARGAGAPVGQANDFGRAALCHYIAGRDPRQLSDALNSVPDGPILGLPLLLAQILESGGPGQIDHGNNPDLVLSYIEALPCKTTCTLKEGGVGLQYDLTCPKQIEPVARLEVPDALYQEWQLLASRLLVPDTDASRISGAGAGLTDND